MNINWTEGPFHSQWYYGEFWLISFLNGNKLTFILVRNGEQPSKGTVFPNVRDARQFLMDNQFEKPANGLCFEMKG